MVEYTKSEARAWAKEKFGGTIAVTHPSYTPDFSGINENAIRHDILKLKELGYAGTLLVAEVNITPEENARITAVAREAAGPDFALFFHAIFNTLEENIHAANAGAEGRRRPRAAGLPRVVLADLARRGVRLHQGASATRPIWPPCCSRFPPGASSESTPQAWSGLRAPRAGRDPEHRRHQGRAGLPRHPRRHGDVPPLPR